MNFAAPVKVDSAILLRRDLVVTGSTEVYLVDLVKLVRRVIAATSAYYWIDIDGVKEWKRVEPFNDEDGNHNDY